MTSHGQLISGKNAAGDVEDIELLDGAVPVSAHPLTGFTTANRYLIPVANLSPFRTSVYDSDLDAEMVYIGDGVTEPTVAADWRYAQQYTSTGDAKTLDRAIRIGDDEDNNVVVVERQNQYKVVARTTTDTAVATGAAGDLLVRVIVLVVPTTAALDIYDGTSAAGTLVLSIPTTAVVGHVYEVDATALTRFMVGLHASGAGTVNCIGRFTA